VRFSCYTGARLWCVGDGAKAVRLKANGQREAVQCPCERVLPGYQGQEKCKVFGRLSVILEGAERIGGVWVFRTTSWNTARNILSSMLLIKQITGGILSGLPLVLTIQPKHVVLANGQGQTVYVVNVEYPGSIEQITRRALEIKRQRTEYKVRVKTGGKLRNLVRRSRRRLGKRTLRANSALKRQRRLSLSLLRLKMLIKATLPKLNPKPRRLRNGRRRPNLKKSTPSPLRKAKKDPHKRRLCGIRPTCLLHAGRNNQRQGELWAPTGPAPFFNN